MSFRTEILIGLLAAMLSGIGVVSAQSSSSGKVGDSGSPVFRITNSPSQNDVELLGLLWGVNAFDPANPWFWYSKARNIFGELQRDPANPSDIWNTCDASFSC